LRSYARLRCAGRSCTTCESCAGRLPGCANADQRPGP